MTSIVLSPAKPDSKIQIDVTAEDQQMINRFARLSLKTEELQEKYNDLKRQAENLEEAENELMLADDEDNEIDADGDDKQSIKPSSNIQFVVGTSFMAVTKTEAENFIEDKKKELKQKMDESNQKLSPMKEEMAQIKSKLYAKFGNNINLDSEDS